MDMQFVRTPDGLVKVIRSGDSRLVQSRSDPNTFGIIFLSTNFVYKERILTHLTEESGPVAWLEMNGFKHEIVYPNSYHDPVWQNDDDFAAVWIRGMIIRVLVPMTEPFPEEFF